MSLAARIQTALGTEVAALIPFHGGDLSEVVRVDTVTGPAIVAKIGTQVETEARMLQAMRDAGAPVPEVLYVEPGLMLLEHLTETPANPNGWRALGSALATLHRKTDTCYGWAEDYAFGAVKIRNSQGMDWPAFWRENRLLPLAGALPKDVRHRLDRLCDQLPDLLPACPAPMLLHGDIWSGNALFSGQGAYLIDPACYYGHAEVDLAMLTLFGSPPMTFWEGYGPVEPRMETRQSIYQLWPALVHLRLFGSGYLGLVTRCLDRAGD